MSKIEFRGNDAHTIGVEVELGLVDETTMELSNSLGDLMANLKCTDKGGQVKPELMQCVLEINTDVCHTVSDAETSLRTQIAEVETVTDQMDLRLWWGATHPFSRWDEQKVTQDERYLRLVDLLQDMARRLVTFGLHVHVGVDTGDKAVMVCDRILHHLPTILSLSCSSPFWEQRDTGLASYRSKIMEGLPTAGLPPLMRNWSEYVWLVNHMVDTGFINSIREIWWDVRPHHNFGTVEVRVCDMPGNLQDTLAITALVQCLVKALSDDIDQGAYQHDCHPMMVLQNKWRSCRYGLNARLVDTYTYESFSAKERVGQLVRRLRPEAEVLGCSDYLEGCLDIASRPSWSERQRSIFDETQDPAEIVRTLTELSRVQARNTPSSS
ncbi:MAG: YbdK family carboxylate-amine ligase [Planctomycetota bacterium]|nr:YbdK family carboxylate-amine ligase [Planctomycetota bacterium]